MLEVQQDGSWPDAPVLVAEFRVAVGRELHDRAERPRSTRPGPAGDRKAVNTDVADAVLASDIRSPSAGIEITGRIVRVMMFQSLSIEIGITGWIFRTFCVPFSGP